MFKILFNIVLGVVLIFIWSRFVNLPQLVSTLSKANFIYLVPMFLGMLVSPVLRAFRLKIFLHKVAKVNLLDLIWLNGIALMLNFFIPIRAGKIVKGVYLNTHYKLGMGKSIVWIFLDRFIDFLAVLILAGVLLLIIPTSLSGGVIKIIVSILSLAVVLTYLVVFQPNFARKFIKFLRPLFIEKHIKIYFDKFSNFILDSFSILRRPPKDLLVMGTITVLAYGADASIWYFAFMSLGRNMDFLKMYLGQLLSALFFLIPAAPGYIGSAEASGLLILSGVFGIEPNLASAMTVLFHILTILFVLIYGLVSLFSLRIDLGAILKKALRRS